ncbi:MAG: tRNA 4-thiouridine(8) synthase ThiI [Deltaproteobacteria bacterium]|nr:tRNA 4-thiouridine(8) synthase ThiI [Deltaproteobacteria bacterium]
MQHDGYIVHYAELATKGRNRFNFIHSLIGNIRRALKELPIQKVEFISGRIWIYPQGDAQTKQKIIAILKRIAGIAYFSPARRVNISLDAIKNCALEIVNSLDYNSFRVRARRAFKQLPLSSLEVDREVGAFLLEKRPAQVKMKGADLEVIIEMVPHGAFVCVERYRGPGGLPVGTGGVVACLLSGGIDSPVAAYRMQRRGCTAIFIHFHSQPFLDNSSTEKACELAQILTQHQGRATLYLIPIGELQREIVLSAPQALRVVLYRRFMVRMAAQIAKRAGAKALVTGEALGQVASQTLTNLAVVDDAATIMILRPLISFDKQEIIDIAKEIGTFEISIAPDQDCCQLFIPKAPETHAKLEHVLKAEAKLDIDKLCDEALAGTRELMLAKDNDSGLIKIIDERKYASNAKP